MLAAGDRAVLLHVRDGKSRSDQGAIAEAERKLASRGIAVSREEPAASDAASGIVDFVRSNRPDMVLMQKGGWFYEGRCANALIKAELTDAGECAVYYDTEVKIEASDNS